jgi:hypothetical protein
MLCIVSGVKFINSTVSTLIPYFPLLFRVIAPFYNIWDILNCLYAPLCDNLPVTFLPTFLIKKNKIRLLRSCCCFCVCMCIPHVNFWTPEPVFMKLGMHVESIWPKYFIKSSHQSMSVCVSPLSLLGNALVNTFPRHRIHNNRGIVGLVDICTVRVISKESVWFSLYIPLSMLGNCSVNTFLWQRRSVGVVFYAVRADSRGSRWLVFPKTSRYIFVCVIFMLELHAFPVCNADSSGPALVSRF